MRRSFVLLLLAPLAGSLAACSSSHDGRDGSMMSAAPAGPSMLAAGGTMSLSPAPGATGVPAGTSLTLRFGQPMGWGMEQYFDLHRGDLGGPVLPCDCTWSGDRTTLTCVPQGPLDPHTSYWIHLGGGMTTVAGTPFDFARYGVPAGGQWVTGGMMGAGFHAGMPWGGMGPAWRAPNGAYGITFPFTTD